jgi:capsular polysaccharide transport system ATP-binding protein
LTLVQSVPGLAPAHSIALRNIVKVYHTPIGPKTVLDDVSFEVMPGEKLAVLGQNGAGKSTLVKIIGGVEQPTSGAVDIGMSMSWPLGFSGGVSANMTGLDNIRFIARIYEKPIRELIDQVDDFAELGKDLYLPVRLYSSGMRARLLFALTLAIDFDCFLIDEVLAVGDQRFQRKCHEALFVQRKHCAMILVSHSVPVIREYCDRALVLKNGRGKVFEDLDFAINIYASL